MDSPIPFPSVRVYLIRHGEVEESAKTRFNGQRDVGLSENGFRELAEVADALSKKEIKAIYSSDLKRALTGAKILADKLGLKVNKEKGLREIDIGEIQGLEWTEVLKKAEGKIEKLLEWFEKGFPKGESLNDLSDRVLEVFGRVLKKERGAVAIFAHGGVNRVILCDQLGVPVKNFFRIEQDYACVNVIDYFEGQGSIVKLINGNASGIK